MLLILLLPLIQQFYLRIPERELDGYLAAESDPPVRTINWTNWTEGEFQGQFQKRANKEFGFRNSLLRLHNQVQWDLFRRHSSEEVVLAKDDYLIERSYIHNHFGRNYEGEDFCKRKAEDLKAVQDSLEAHGLKFLIVFAPSKAAYHADLIPEALIPKGEYTSHYEDLSQMLPEMGVHLLDFDAWFRSLKAKTPHPLFPKSGTHWSIYGAYLAADSLMRRISQDLGSPLPRIEIDSIYTSKKNFLSDYDIGKSLNLLFQSNTIPMAYPAFHYAPQTGQCKPKTLFIGDSFFFMFRRLHLHRSGLGGGHFWYYNEQVFAFPPSPVAEVDKLDWMEVLEEHEQVVIIANVANLAGMPWGFCNDALLYFRSLPARLEQKFKARIAAAPQWQEDLKTKAAQSGKTLDKVIAENAAWLAAESIRKSNSEHERLAYAYLERIEKDADWKKLVHRKAEQTGRLYEEILWQDALWLAAQEIGKQEKIPD